MFTTPGPTAHPSVYIHISVSTITSVIDAIIYFFIFNLVATVITIVSVIIAITLWPLEGRAGIAQPVQRAFDQNCLKTKGPQPVAVDPSRPTLYL